MPDTNRIEILRTSAYEQLVKMKQELDPVMKLHLFESLLKDIEEIHKLRKKEKLGKAITYLEKAFVDIDFRTQLEDLNSIRDQNFQKENKKLAFLVSDDRRKGGRYHDYRCFWFWNNIFLTKFLALVDFDENVEPETIDLGHSRTLISFINNANILSSISADNTSEEEIIEAFLKNMRIKLYASHVIWIMSNVHKPTSEFWDDFYDKIWSRLPSDTDHWVLAIFLDEDDSFEKDDLLEFTFFTENVEEAIENDKCFVVDSLKSTTIDTVKAWVAEQDNRPAKEGIFKRKIIDKSFFEKEDICFFCDKKTAEGTIQKITRNGTGGLIFKSKGNKWHITIKED